MRRAMSLILLAAACSKGPPTIDPSPQHVESPDQNPPPPPVLDAAPPADGEKAPNPADDPLFYAPRDIKPPPVRGLPAQKTTDVIKDARLNALAALDVPDWTREPSGVTQHVAVLKYKTQTRPWASVDIIIQPCVIQGMVKCIPMDLATWKAGENEEALDEAFPKYMRKQAQRSETGVATIGGVQAVFEYHLVSTVTTDIRGRVRQVGGHAYTLHWNDGVNKIRVTAQFEDVPPKDAETLGGAITKEQLVATAKGFFELYTSQWASQGAPVPPPPAPTAPVGSGSGSATPPAPVAPGSGSATPPAPVAPGSGSATPPAPVVPVSPVGPVGSGAGSAKPLAPVAPAAPGGSSAAASGSGS